MTFIKPQERELYKEFIEEKTDLKDVTPLFRLFGFSNNKDFTDKIEKDFKAVCKTKNSDFHDKDLAMKYNYVAWKKYGIQVPEQVPEKKVKVIDHTIENQKLFNKYLINGYIQDRIIELNKDLLNMELSYHTRVEKMSIKIYLMELLTN